MGRNFRTKSYFSLFLIQYRLHLIDIFISICLVSESESTKGSVDCLPKLNFQSSTSIVRLSGTGDNSANKMPGENTGELNSIHLLCAG